MRAAFQKVATMEACLDRAVFSASASSTLDCGVFLERQEFRKSAELAWNKANIRIQEMSQRGHFISDLLKRFVVNEEIDCRVNYGFTSKRCFGTSMQVQELNFENIPIIEDSADRAKCCEHLRRRVVALLMGKATWTGDPASVNPSEGVYLLLPQDDLVDFLSHPVTAALYLREWCIPFFLETTVREGLEMINHLDKVDPVLAKDTEWLALRLSGSNIPPPATILDVEGQSNKLIAAVHATTPWTRCVRQYLLHKVDALPGCISSTKNKRTKISYFVEALDNASWRLFRQIDAACFQKLLIDWNRLVQAMTSNGGEASFGTWTDWGCAFDFLETQTKWDGSAYIQQGNLHRASAAADVGPMVYPNVCSLHETVNIEALLKYSAHRTDRRQAVLDAYVLRHCEQGVREGALSTICVNYYKKPHYGRLMAKGPAGQKLTREARAVASHCAELDAPCCHPRLLQRQLQQLDMWDPVKSIMLDKFIVHYKEWRLWLGRSQSGAHPGGKPSVEAPFLLKLCDEVQCAAQMILRHPSALEWSDLYNDRRNPEFSRLSAILSVEEAKMLAAIYEDIPELFQVFIFDGGYVNDRHLADQVAVIRTCDASISRGVPVAVKTWSRPATTLPQELLRRGAEIKNCPHVAHSYGNCLLNAVATIQPEYPVQHLLPALKHTTELSASQFNAAMTAFPSSSSETKWWLRHEAMAPLQDYAKLGGQWLCHQAQSAGGGHWWATTFDLHGNADVIDPEAGNILMSLLIDDLAAVYKKFDNIIWFRLANGGESPLVATDGPYALAGSGSCAESVIPLAVKSWPLGTVPAIPRMPLGRTSRPLCWIGLSWWTTRTVSMRSPHFALIVT